MCLVLASCGNDTDPFGPVSGAADASVGGGADSAPGTTADASPGIDATPLTCAEKPTRMVVLGDSITACSTIGGKNASGCSPKILHSYMDSTHAPDITYENHAVAAAVTNDIARRQLDDIETGKSGHVLVVIYIGGNDLQPYIFISDNAAQDRFDTDMPRILGEWETILEFFNDTSRFPDGATIVMNTQYNPFDDCTASPYNLSALKISLLGMFNDNLVAVANQHSNVVITDQHGPYLGHGHHYNVSSCPHYDASAEPWMSDLIHPNAAGHANLATEWQRTVDLIYSASECQ